MECSLCKGYELKPTKLDYELPARICIKCDGLLIDLLSYRTWLETAPDFSEPNKEASVSVKENDKALVCKKCNRVMLKYKISSDTSNHVDLCTSCDDAWLDSGEWEILKYLKLHKDLAKIFTEPWQYKIRNEIEKKNYEARFKELLGKDEYEKLKNTKDWISSHKNNKDLIRYLLKDE